MDNLDSCLPVSKPSFLSIGNTSSEITGLQRIASVISDDTNLPVDKKFTQQEINFNSEVVSSALYPTCHLESQSEQQKEDYKKLTDRTHQLLTEGKLTFGECVILRDSKGHVFYGLKGAK